MADYGDTSGGNSDQAIRDIVAQLVFDGTPAPAAAPAQAPYAAPEVTPTMLQGTAAAPASQPIAIPPQAIMPAPQGSDWGPTQQLPPSRQVDGPYDIMPARSADEQAQRDQYFPGGSAYVPGPGAPLVITPPTAAAPAASAGDDWTAPAPSMVAPAVTPLGTMASVRARAPAMGMVLGVPVRR